MKITKDHKHFKELLFICKAVEKTEANSNYLFLQAKEIKSGFFFIAATNGFRIHFTFLYLNDFEAGFYVLKNFDKDSIEIEKGNELFIDLYQFIFNQGFLNDAKINFDAFKYLSFYNNNDYSFSKFCVALYKELKREFSFSLNYFQFLSKFANNDSLRVFVEKRNNDNLQARRVLFNINEVYSLTLPKFEFN